MRRASNDPPRASGPRPSSWRGPAAGQPRRAGREADRPAERGKLAGLERIGRALASADSLEAVLPELWLAMASALPLRAAVLLVEGAASTRRFTFPAAGDGHAHLPEALRRAETTLEYLRRPAKAPPRRARGTGPINPQAAPGMVTLPLWAKPGPILGVLLAHGEVPFTESDVSFLDAIASLLAIDSQRRQASAAAAEARAAARQLGGLEDITQQIIQADSLAAALPGVLHALSRLLAADAAVLLQATEDGVLHRIASVGLREPAALELVPGDGALGRIAEAGGVRIGDLAVADRVPQALRDSGMRSLIGAPLQAGAVAGALCVASLEADHFTPAAHRLLATVTERIAGTVERSRHLSEYRRLARQLERVGQAFVGIADLGATTPRSSAGMLEQIVQDARRVARADYAAIGLGADAAGRFDSWVSESFASPPVALFGAQRDATLDLAGLGPSLAIPVEHQGNRIGTLFLGRKPGRRPFDRQDQRSMVMFAAHAAIAMDNQRLHAALATERERFRLLAEASEEFSRTLEPAQVLQALADRVVGTLGDWCVVDQLTPDRRGLERVAMASTEPTRADEVTRFAGQPPALDSDHPVAAAVRTGKPVLLAFRRLAAAPLPDSALDHVEVHDQGSHAVVPIMHRDNLIGALTVGTFMFGASGVRRLTRDDLILATEYALRAGVALDNSRHHQRALAAIKSRDVVLSVVTHDLRNPLSSIQMRAELLAEKYPAIRHHSESLLKSAGRMDCLIDDLLKIGKLESGTLTLEPRPTLAHTLIAEAVEAATPAAAHKGVTVASSAPDVPLPLRCDPLRINQVLSNLVGNAIKFTGAGGTVTVSAALDPQAADRVRFAVADTGCGIPAADLPHVFDRYWQASKTAGLGTGLGLSIARGLIEAHGGRIEVTSVPDQGTTFTFWLPLDTEPV